MKIFIHHTMVALHNRKKDVKNLSKQSDYDIEARSILCGKLSRISVALITRKMAIANETGVSFCNQPKAHFGLSVYTPLGQSR